MVDPTEPEPWIVDYVAQFSRAEVTDPDPDDPNHVIATDVDTGEEVDLRWSTEHGQWEITPE